MQDPIVLTDTHTHIYYHHGSPELQEHIHRASEKGITRFFLPNVDVDSIKPVMATVGDYPESCFPMLGLHPCSVKEDYKVQLDTIQRAISDHKIYAIGEIGIDLYWDKTTLKAQQDAFRTQIEWAKALRLPIDIHCREAFDEIFEVLEDVKDDRLYGIFHCFTGTEEQARRAIALDFKLGIGGVVTFKNAGLDNVVREIDLSHIVLETDAPYLAPVPYRGKENESSYLYLIAQKIADLHQLPLAEIARITTENSKEVFKI